MAEWTLVPVWLLNINKWESKKHFRIRTKWIIRVVNKVLIGNIGNIFLINLKVAYILNMTRPTDSKIRLILWTAIVAIILITFISNVIGN